MMKSKSVVVLVSLVVGASLALGADPEVPTVVALVNGEPILDSDVQRACSVPGPTDFNILERIILRRLALQKIRGPAFATPGAQFDVLSEDELLELLHPTPIVTNAMVLEHFRGHRPVYEASASKLVEEVEQGPAQGVPQRRLNYVGLGAKVAPPEEWQGLSVGASTKYFKDGRWWVATCLWAETRPSRSFKEVEGEIRQLLQRAMNGAHHAQTARSLRSEARVEIVRAEGCAFRRKN